ncbi:MBL fold metallo-hydrolase [Hoeflea ulvae]|uniref:MBL fold metallo-hydrolase n=1 Tax=Hoeflea ulvae TaxID=2983764 RepID=A0ABT3YM69_9HYPH|nr:MBL fold metallo-hydrolase [Hoeflea ulvae]MCY0096810.1 MBL fold metallo-hydrolase [Hoeflea ulvae]
MNALPDALRFPYEKAPAPGEVTKVADGLLWACLPLPFRLNHVNVWLLENEDGWTVIDTGCVTPQIKKCWEKLLADPMRGEPVRTLIATHGHVDHIGLAGWLVDRFGSEFVGTFGEWVWARLSHTRDVPGSNTEHHRFMRGHGFDDAGAELMLTSRHRFIDMSSTIPGAITEIRDGEIIRFGRRDWRVIVTRGHAFEHASFYCERDNILIAGDHLLPKITPVIAVYEMLPHADPLGDYLDSFAQFADIPEDVLVLPSHGRPYYGVHTRIRQLQEHHTERLDATITHLRKPQHALALSKTMFPHVEGPENVGFALGEVLAHINYLVHDGVVGAVSDEHGHVIYESLA